MPCMLCVYTDVAEVGFTSAKVARVRQRAVLGVACLPLEELQLDGT
jgi:hypothetical protein